MQGLEILPKHPYEARVSRVRSTLERIGRLPMIRSAPADACIILCQNGVGWEDIYYMSGFRGSSGVLIVTRDDAVLFVDPRYAEAARESHCCRPVSCTDAGRQSPFQAALDFVSAMKPKRVAYGGKCFSHASYRYMETVLGSHVELLDISSLLQGYRRRKSKCEVDLVRAAVEVASRSFIETVEEAHEGTEEREFAASMEYRMKRYGADFMDTVPIMVVSGDRSSRPHSLPTNRRFVRGDLVIVDFSARVSGYACDITRMLSVGEPADDIKSFYSILKWAQAEAASLIKAGALASDVDAAAREIIAGAGLGDYFIHGTGHGIGLGVHESPSINASSGAILATGDIVAIEPGFYRSGWGGMRLEDDYLVTPSGFERLTGELSNDLFVIK